MNNAPELWRETRAKIHQAREAGLQVNGQVGCRPIGVTWGLETSTNPFSTHPAWQALRDLTPAQRYDRLMRDADLRRVLVEQRPDDEYTRMADAALAMTYVVDENYDYEPDPAVDSVAAQARARGTDPRAFALEAMMQDGGKRLLSHTFENYFEGSLEVIREMLTDEATIMGLGDGGAHVCTICDCSSPTFLLTHWARDRKRGDKLPIELLVRKQTRDSALAYGLRDRGVLAPGYRADINVIDFRPARAAAARSRLRPSRRRQALDAEGARVPAHLPRRPRDRLRRSADRGTGRTAAAVAAAKPRLNRK